MNENSHIRNCAPQKNVIQFPVKTPLKTLLYAVPSQARYYIKCPHFLLLSNNKKIYIEYSQIASQKGNLFEKIVLNRMSGETGHTIIRAKQATDILTPGLYTINKKADIEFYAYENVGFKVGMFKPDLILSKGANNGIEITIFEVKNSSDLQLYHYLQAYVYKLTLQKLLQEKMPVHIKVGMLHWRGGLHPKREYALSVEAFKNKCVTMDLHSSIVETPVALESEIILEKALQEIASLRVNISECYDCPGKNECGYSL
jgi:hypothetical protein